MMQSPIFLCSHFKTQSKDKTLWLHFDMASLVSSVRSFRNKYYCSCKRKLKVLFWCFFYWIYVLQFLIVVNVKWSNCHFHSLFCAFDNTFLVLWGFYHCCITRQVIACWGEAVSRPDTWFHDLFNLGFSWSILVMLSCVSSIFCSHAMMLSSDFWVISLYVFFNTKECCCVILNTCSTNTRT